MTRHEFYVLSKPVPDGGRALTEHECKALRKAAAGAKLDLPCSPRWRVQPGIGGYAYPYRPLMGEHQKIQNVRLYPRAMKGWGER